MWDRTQVMITPYLISGPGQLEMCRERTLLPVKLALEPWEGGSTTLQGTLWRLHVWRIQDAELTESLYLNKKV